jgi:predicted nucleic acid-binding protein
VEAGIVEMILLDTHVLIRMLVKDTPSAEWISRRLADGDDLCTSVICWYEFVSGPVDDEGVALAYATIADRVLPFTAEHAHQSSRIWNEVGRRRSMRINAMVAGAAIVADAELATANEDDFRPFVQFGLRLSG